MLDNPQALASQAHRQLSLALAAVAAAAPSATDEWTTEEAILSAALAASDATTAALAASVLAARLRTALVAQARAFNTPAKITRAAYAANRLRSDKSGKFVTLNQLKKEQ